MRYGCLICNRPRAEKLTILKIRGTGTPQFISTMVLDGYCQECLSEMEYSLLQGIWDAHERLKKGLGNEQDVQIEGGNMPPDQ